MKILVTGCAGFIGFHLCLKLIKKKNISLFGIDNLNDYYDVNLKKNRLKILKKTKKIIFYNFDLNNSKKLQNSFRKNKYDIIIHLAAQAGVRYSISNPRAYLDTNINAFFNILNMSNKYKVKHLLFASSSSVYGNNANFPLSENEKTDTPVSFYAATKKCNEIMCYSFSAVHNLSCTGLRLFTVYGSFGRPDMSLFKFVDSIYRSKKIFLFNRGKHIRDFTYIDDVVNAIIKLIKKPSRQKIPYQIFNIAGSRPITLMSYVKIIEKIMNKKAIINFKSFQIGDVYKTYGNIKKLRNYIKFKPKTNIEKGIKIFYDWYLAYYNKN